MNFQDKIRIEFTYFEMMKIRNAINSYNKWFELNEARVAQECKCKVKPQLIDVPIWSKDELMALKAHFDKIIDKICAQEKILEKLIEDDASLNGVSVIRSNENETI